MKIKLKREIKNETTILSYQFKLKVRILSFQSTYIIILRYYFSVSSKAN